MSTIPNSAIPHAVDHEIASAETSTEDAVAKAKDALGGLVKDVEEFARQVGERVKAAPKGAQIAVGAVAVAGSVAAAAVPLVRAARKPAAPAKPKRSTAPKAAAAPRKAASPRKPASSSARKPKAGTPA